MAQNDTYTQMLSCADSPLSITGNIIGIVTLTYTIIITLLYYGYQLAKSSSDLSCQLDSMRVELVSLESTMERLVPYVDRLPKHLADEVRSTVLGGRRTLAEDRYYLNCLINRGNSSLVLNLIFRGLFIAKKIELAERYGNAIKMRIKLDGIYNAVIQSLILDEIKLLNRRQSELSYYQKAFFNKAMNGLHLSCPAITIEREETQNLNGPNAFDILNEYLRPQTRWDPPGPRESLICSKVGEVEGSTDITPNGN